MGPRRLSHGATCVAQLPGLRMLLGYRYEYAIHGSPYTSAYVLIDTKWPRIELAHGVVLPESSV